MSFTTMWGTIDMNFYGLGIVCVLLFLFYRIYQEHTTGKIEWTDLITGRDSTRLSLTKVLQLVGGLTGTWIMIYMTIHDKLTYDLFLIYLTYVGAIEGWSKYVSARYSSNTNAVNSKQSTNVDPTNNG